MVVGRRKYTWILACARRDSSSVCDIRVTGVCPIAQKEEAFTGPLTRSLLSTTTMSDYEDDSMMQNGSDDQPTKPRDPLDDEEEEDTQPPRRSRYEDDEEEEEEEEGEGEGVPGDSRAKKKVKVRVFCSGFTKLHPCLFGFRDATEGLRSAVSSTSRPKSATTRTKRIMTMRMDTVRLFTFTSSLKPGA